MRRKVKFKKGDIIQCLFPDVYYVTKPGVFLKVKVLCADDLIGVDVISGEHKGGFFYVNANYFDRVCDRAI